MAYLGVLLIFCLGGVTLSESATGYTLINGSCLNNAECTIPNAACQDGLCVCNINYITRPDSLGCLPVVTNYQGTCEEPVQCKIGNIPQERLSCGNGRCECHSDYYYRDGSCQGKAQLGESCTDDSECAQLETNDNVVWCFNKACTCRKGYKPEGNRCVIGGNCEKDDDCTGVSNSGLGNSFCDKQRTRELYQCSCKQGFVSSLNDTKCLEEIPRLGESCVDDAQCKSLLGAAECKNNLCVCRPDAKEQKGKCNGASGLASISALLLLLFIPTRFII